MLFIKTFTYTSSWSQLLQNLNECSRQECKPGIRLVYVHHNILLGFVLLLVKSILFSCTSLQRKKNSLIPRKIRKWWRSEGAMENKMKNISFSEKMWECKNCETWKMMSFFLSFHTRFQICIIQTYKMVPTAFLFSEAAYDYQWNLRLRIQKMDTNGIDERYKHRESEKKAGHFNSQKC